jgi:hypothetical protein
MTQILDPVEQIHEMDGLSNQYQFISSKEVVSTVGSLGWDVHSIQRTAVRSDKRKGFQNHLIDFRNSDVKLSEDESLISRLLYFGSHDGKSADKLMAGAFSFVCGNGLIMGTEFFSHRVIHKGDKALHFLDAVIDITQKFNVLGEIVKQMRKTIMEREQINSYLNEAEKLKFNHDNGLFFEKPALLITKRKEEASNSVWNVYNKTQENIFMGGMQGVRFNDSGIPQFFTTRKVDSMKDKIRINTGLFTNALTNITN